MLWKIVKLTFWNSNLIWYIIFDGCSIRLANRQVGLFGIVIRHRWVGECFGTIMRFNNYIFKSGFALQDPIAINDIYSPKKYWQKKMFIISDPSWPPMVVHLSAVSLQWSSNMSSSVPRLKMTASVHLLPA